MPVTAFRLECMIDSQLKLAVATGNDVTTQEDKHMTAWHQREVTKT